ncbi:flagellar protein FliT [Paenibacillus sedimenti]|uniref:Flagellar protein FliT n=1 Tax=Paenibacillus sedimenti TaxID=2770274 RepID=A0A926QLZ4_9BACL|nr:flagellar protein FliT [Paenibacillus sedimenti]MBD0384160.1 flagellar protein FliT [Paenibacillus sedimenti]
MDEVIAKLEQLTADVLQQIDSIEWEALEQFVENRDELISELGQFSTSVPSEAQRERIQKILTHDLTIIQRMVVYKSEAESQISKLSNAQKTKNAYNSYYSSESHFVDKRK